MKNKRVLTASARLIPVIAVLAGLILAGCAPKPAGETGTEIIEAKSVAGLLAKPGTVLVDARNMPDYREKHISGAVNISRADIVVMTPFPALLAPAEQIERVMGSRGIGNDTLVVIYDDNNNMDSSRLWWTLKIYGHDKVKVVSGGLQALLREGLKTDTSIPSVSPAVFKAAPKREDMIISAHEIRGYLNEPSSSVIIIDTRTEDEYMAGHIPGAELIDYRENNFRDGTFRPVSHIRIKYLEAGIDYKKEVVLYCLTSIRGTQTFLALYNAGYRNLRLYDGAWVEWSANPMNPIHVPEPETMKVRAPDQS